MNGQYKCGLEIMNNSFIIMNYRLISFILLDVFGTETNIFIIFLNKNYPMLEK